MVSVRSSLFRVARASVVLFALASAGSAFVACGGPAASFPMAATPPPEKIKQLTFLLVPAHGNEAPIASTNDVVQSAFIAAEYKITTDPNDPHDAVITLDTTAAEKQSFFTMTVNGQRQVDYTVRVNLTVKDGGKIADERTFEFTTSGGQAPSGAGYALVNDLTDSMRFRHWADSATAKPVAASTSAIASASAAPTATAPQAQALVAPPPQSTASQKMLQSTTPSAEASARAANAAAHHAVP